MAREKKMGKCKFCSKVLSANPPGGTQYLQTYAENCKRQYLGEKDPMQSHLQFQMDGLISTRPYDPMVARESLVRLIATTDLPINFGLYEDHIRRLYCPQFKKVSRKTTRNDIIACYNKICLALISEIG